MAPPSILIIGATGNTGRGVTSTLPSLLKQTKSLSNHHIIALSRSKDSPAAKTTAASGIEVIEFNWIELTASWLESHKVQRIFIASHNEPTHFAEEGQLHNEALLAGVKYVVRISTTAANVAPNYRAYYPRTHWAIDQMLSSKEFDAMEYTSLQPNVFFPYSMQGAVDFIRHYRKTGSQPEEGLSTMLDEHAPVGIIAADDVGVFAAHLLASDNISPHAGKHYVLNGPEDISGRKIVDLVEEYIGGEKVKKTVFRDLRLIEKWADATQNGSKNVIRSVVNAPVTGYEGKCKAETTSEEVLRIAAPKGTARGYLEGMLKE
ncbi:hypothetical protein CLAFUW4_14686 [Fulvia fulva]|uniref:NmrA-like domain-containing protein n=1 Tax=Passalora fulva TaxID=5499 RepID=A0A9Q8UWK2_PASFU|nr:uncharacterized protein CLAFUR5_14514 [Fulvia fulva]KAK4609297.1 hypothetical protein CLAFUR4_14678 [Fulvia fulva]KAK4609596.1 hypothetical protein CLAFUR0_14678 [Fulvia fulva]UJO25075.1 hypothetical protein CLAFUR5_14514 [Fulvia fulva]WPV22793.1 hypothetical protein CLAFUW4_14686 [Fulvia fulva]WPV37640.1 hypothetical protein CLAFUW7_14687 [Fulvia fulva]